MPPAELSVLGVSLEELNQARINMEGLGRVNNVYVRSRTPEERLLYAQWEHADSVYRTETEKVHKSFDGLRGQQALSGVVGKVTLSNYDPKIKVATIVSGIKTNIDTFDRVQDGLDETIGYAMDTTDEGAGLYVSMGRKSLKVDNQHGNKFGISAELRGVFVGINSPAQPSFPKIDRNNDSYIIESLVSRYKNPRDTLKQWDPKSKDFKLPFTVLGTEEQPRQNRTLNLSNDQQRFGLRASSIILGQESWVKVARPNVAFRERFTECFAEVFTDLLAGKLPRDKETDVDAQYSNTSGRTYVATTSQRSKSLTDFTLPEMQLAFSAAGITAAEVAGVTKEMIGKLGSIGTASAVYAHMQASRDYTQFFGELFGLEV